MNFMVSIRKTGTEAVYKVKVYMINTVCSGSTGHIMTDIYEKVLKEGGECRIAYGRGTAPSGVNAFKTGGRADNVFHAVKSRLFDAHGFGSAAATKRLVEDIKNFGPDIIHLHNIHGYYLNIQILFDFLKDYNRPVVWTLHDCWAFTGHCAYYGNCVEWQNGCLSCPGGARKSYPESFVNRSGRNLKLKKNLFLKPDRLTLVPVSYWLEGEVRKSFLSGCDIQTIQNGVDLDRFSYEAGDLRDRLNIKDKYTVVCSAARWDARNKGYARIKKTAEKLGDSYRFVIIGEKIPYGKMPENMIAVGSVDFESLKKYYSMADLFLNASNQETFGLVTVEALACGTPVVVCGATACAEAVSPECAIIADKNSSDFAEEIKSAEAARFDRDACRKQAEKFAKESQLNSYYKLYESILNGSQKNGIREDCNN